MNHRSCSAIAANSWFTVAAILAALVGASPVYAAVTVAHTFGLTTADGQDPFSTPSLGSDGAFYGVTQYGGASNRGIVYRYAPSSGTPAVLHAFGGSDGQYPYAEPVDGADGFLYGTTIGGGAGSAGTIYRIHKDGTGFATLRSLTFGTDGGSPYGVLAFAADGFFYGVCEAGGAGGKGSVFKIKPDGSGFLVLHAFSGATTDGASPYAGVIVASDGKLYGTASKGGPLGRGMIYRLARDGTGFAIVHAFAFNDGDTPYTALTQSGASLYGVTSTDGAKYFGTVFRVGLDGSMYTVLHEFSNVGADGGQPQGRLVIDSAGTVYGTCVSGGNAANLGCVFSLSAAGAFANLQAFSLLGAGNAPYGGPRIVGSSLWFTTSNGGTVPGSSSSTAKGALCSLPIVVPPPANTPPTISAIADRSVRVSQSTGPIAITVGDAESAANSLTLAASSDDATLVPPTGLILGGSGSSRTLTITPAMGQLGSATITVSVSDGSLSAQTSFTVTVLDRLIPDITWSTPASIVAGTPLTTAQCNATSNVPGTFTYTPAIGVVLPAGSHQLVAAFAPDDTSDYAPTSATVTLQVQPSASTPLYGDTTTTHARCGTGAGLAMLAPLCALRSLRRRERGTR